MARPKGIKNIYDAGMTGLGPEDLRQNAQTFDTNLSNESIPNPNSPASRTFDKTNLDLEDARVLGGPNRTEGGGDGFYTVQGDNSDNPLSVGGVPLRNDDGTFVEKQIHPYTPQKTYLQVMNDANNNSN
jgi:hypothetical protein